MNENTNNNSVQTIPSTHVVPMSQAAGAGLFAGAIAGMLAASAGGKLGLGGFIVFMLFVSGIQPAGRKALAVLLFVVAAASCAVLFRK